MVVFNRAISGSSVEKCVARNLLSNGKHRTRTSSAAFSKGVKVIFSFIFNGAHKPTNTVENVQVYQTCKLVRPIEDDKKEVHF